MTQATPSNGSGADKAAAERDVLESFAPFGGGKIGETPVMSADEVREVVARARRAQVLWAETSWAERSERLLRFRDALMDRSDDVVQLLSRETGKPRYESLMHELSVVVDLCSYYAKHAQSMLAPEERPMHMMKHRRSTVMYVPRGVVGIIAPWNYPLLMPWRDIVVAVMAGNAAVVKPSEVTPIIMHHTKEIWDAAGMPNDLLGVVTGFGPTGAALIDAGIDMCVFTGSVSTGRRVAAACGERLIPCVMELGGKAPLIACGDCDVERTARDIVNGGFTNSGQACIAVERVYAHRDVYDRLLDRVVELTGKLSYGDPSDHTSDVGGITFEQQIRVAEAHIDDAVRKGARLCIGGKRRGDGNMAFEPTVIADCTHDHSVMTEEIFGPIVPFMKVSSDDEALQLANASHLGLNAYVYSEDSARGRRLAERLEAGSVLVNGVLMNAGMPEAPFGGMKHSGFGRVMGIEGLRAMCHVKHINVDRFRSPLDKLVGFPYSDKTYRRMQKTLRMIYTSGGIFKRLSELF